jgi:hypothetical protein
MITPYRINATLIYPRPSHRACGSPDYNIKVARLYNGLEANMALQCNIDSRGKRARLVSGIVMVIVALILVGAWAWPSRSAVGWAIALFFILAGAFSIFEARAGWCALRAMGFKTRV